MARLSVLDQSPVRSGAKPADAIRETLALAEACDRLGYTRYWLAEHHSTPALAGSAPEVLIGQVAARTSRIRVGSGGVMLQHYSPLKVAEAFRVLETLFPGRIDLGLGRAPGSDQLTARALAGPAGGSPELFPQQVGDLLAWLAGEPPPEHPFAKVRAMPTGDSVPEVWLLGSSDQSAALAAHFGTAFSFAHFINADGGAQITRAYAREFKPSALLAGPRASVAVFVIDPTETCGYGLPEQTHLLQCLREQPGSSLPTSPIRKQGRTTASPSLPPRRPCMTCCSTSTSWTSSTTQSSPAA